MKIRIIQENPLTRWEEQVEDVNINQLRAFSQMLIPIQNSELSKSQGCKSNSPCNRTKTLTPISSPKKIFNNKVLNSPKFKSLASENFLCRKGSIIKPNIKTKQLSVEYKVPKLYFEGNNSRKSFQFDTTQLNCGNQQPKNPFGNIFQQQSLKNVQYVLHKQDQRKISKLAMHQLKLKVTKPTIMSWDQFILPKPSESGRRYQKPSRDSFNTIKGSFDKILYYKLDLYRPSVKEPSQGNHSIISFKHNQRRKQQNY